MAPESIGRRPSRSSDQYSLAITYYQLRTGKLPYSGSVSLPELIEIHKNGRLDFSAVPPAEQAVLKKATAIDPKIRYPTCRAMADAMAKALDKPSADKSGAWFRTWAAVVLLGLILVPLIIYLWGQGIDRLPPPEPTVITLKFDPPDSHYEIQIQNPGSDREPSKHDGQGDFEINLQHDDVVAIRVTSNDPYRDTYDRTLTVDQVTALEGKIELPRRTSQQVRVAAYQLLRDGDRESALRLMSSAAQVDRSIVKMPGDSAVVGSTIGKVEAVAASSVNSTFIVVADNGRGAYQLGALRMKGGGPVSGTEPQVDFEPVAVIADHSSSFVEALRFDRQTNRVIVVREDAIQLIDTTGDGISVKEVWRQEGAGPDKKVGEEVVTFSPDGRMLAMQYVSAVRVWPVSDSAVWQPKLFEIEDEDALVAGVDFGPDNEYINVFCDGSAARQFDLDSQVPNASRQLQVPDELLTASIVGVRQLGTHAAIVATEDAIFFGDREPSAAQVGFKPLGIRSPHVERMDTSSDGRWLMICGGGDPRIQLWSREQQKVVLSASSAELQEIYDVDFSNDGRWLAVTSHDGGVYLIELESPRLIRIYQSDQGHCRLIKFAAETGLLLAIVDGNQADRSVPVILDLKPFELDLAVAFQSGEVKR
jgi:WD40 repeat protein